MLQVVMKLLRRELLLTRGRLQTLMYESMKLNRELHRTKAQALTVRAAAVPLLAVYSCLGRGK